MMFHVFTLYGPRFFGDFRAYMFFFPQRKASSKIFVQTQDLFSQKDFGDKTATSRRVTRYINRSLFELANCILALCDGNRDHVPFRTRVLYERTQNTEAM